MATPLAVMKQVSSFVAGNIKNLRNLSENQYGNMCIRNYGMSVFLEAVSSLVRVVSRQQEDWRKTVGAKTPPAPENPERCHAPAWRGQLSPERTFSSAAAKQPLKSSVLCRVYPCWKE